MGKFEIYKDTQGEYRFRLKARNGEIILSSEWYSSKEACYHGIESVKENSSKKEAFEIKASSHSSYHFDLKAWNGRIIGVSQIYHSKNSAENGIESVMHNAPEAEIKELLIKL